MGNEQWAITRHYVSCSCGKREALRTVTGNRRPATSDRTTLM